MRGLTWMQLAALALALVARPAGAQTTPTRISDSKHNFQLLTNPVHVAPALDAEDGLCVFCHTPHKGASSLLLWNRGIL